MRTPELLIKNLIPKRYRAFWLSKYRAWAYRGENVSCPCCGGCFSEFLPFGVEVRPGAQCPQCNCLERHRTIWLFLKHKTDLFTAPLKMLHVAPERVYSNAFRKLPNLDYLSIDLAKGSAMMQMDVTALRFPENTFDVVMCNHVLEHIPEDGLAMRELCRVLKPGGWAILQTPVDCRLETTFEDPSVTTPEERLRLFGQDDHVRIYGRDFKDRLEAAGFDVAVENYDMSLAPEQIATYGLSTQDVYFCRKPLSQQSHPSSEKVVYCQDYAKRTVPV